MRRKPTIKHLWYHCNNCGHNAENTQIKTKSFYNDNQEKDLKDIYPICNSDNVFAPALSTNLMNNFSEKSFATKSKREEILAFNFASHNLSKALDWNIRKRLLKRNCAPNDF